MVAQSYPRNSSQLCEAFGEWDVESVGIRMGRNARMGKRIRLGCISLAGLCLGVLTVPGLLLLLAGLHDGATPYP